MDVRLNMDFFLNITFVPSEFWNSSNAQVMARCHVISQTIHFTRFNGCEWLIMWGILCDGKYHLWTVINCFNFFNILEPRWFWFFIFSQLLNLWNSLASLYPIWYKGVKPAMIMNEMPVIGSLCLRKDFWDRQGVKAYLHGTTLSHVVESSSRNGLDILKKLAINRREITQLSLFSCIFVSKACFYTCQRIE